MRLQLVCARNRRLIVLLASAFLAAFFAPMLWIWTALVTGMLAVAWAADFAKLMRQLSGAKGLGVGAVIFLQQMPALQLLAVDFIDAFAVYFSCVYIALCLGH